jgi:hypothetical protein
MVDRRKRYICIVDCETIGRPFHNKAREIGALMVDKKGVIYDSREWTVQEVFLPSKNKRKLAPTAAQAIQEEMKEMLERYGCKTLAGYNTRYDRVALQNIGVDFPTAEWWDIHRMTKSVIVPRKTYRKFCEKHGYLTKCGQPKSTAEVVGKYLKQNVGYVQSHSGLPDCELENQIMAACIRQHKKMRR